jgi:hypothetical protein
MGKSNPPVVGAESDCIYKSQVSVLSRAATKSGTHFLAGVHVPHLAWDARMGHDEAATVCTQIGPIPSHRKKWLILLGANQPN